MFSLISYFQEMNNCLFNILIMVTNFNGSSEYL